MSKYSNNQRRQRSASAKQNKRVKAAVPPSNIPTRSRSPGVCETEASETPKPTDGGNTNGQNSAMNNFTSTRTELPEGNHIIISVSQCINVRTSQGLLFVGCKFVNLC
jgi:hypothetical protein